MNFYVFLAATFAAYYLFPPRYKWRVLLAGSYLFYALADFRVMYCIVFTTITVFYTGRMLDKVHKKQALLFSQKDAQWLKENRKECIARFTRERRRILLAALLLNFGILALIKYSGFVSININLLLGAFSVPFQIPTLHFLLPLGISFYTFQSMGYIMDVYRGKYPADDNLFKFALFVSFFPQIIQGPISRHDQLAKQLYEPHSFDYTQFKHGIELIVWGTFKKAVIADRAAQLVVAVIPNYERYPGFGIVYAIIASMLQVYTDFSGGIDISRGVAQCLGIDMVENFRRPYFATSVSDYWRRWHITLGAWMKDYLLYPVSLSRAFSRLGKFSRKHFGNYLGKLIPACLGMVIVFLAVGIWHGANWKYIIYGLYYGFLIVAGLLMEPPLQRLRKKHPSISTDKPFWHVFAILRTVFLVYIGKFFSIADNVPEAISMMKLSFSKFNPQILFTGYLADTGFNKYQLFLLCVSGLCLFCVSFLQEKGVKIRVALDERHLVVRWGVYYIFLFGILLFSVSSSMTGGFFYAQF